MHTLKEGIPLDEPKKKHDIKEAAKLLFQEFGFSHVTMEEIALRANASKGTLYKYFPDKLSVYEDLLKEIREKERVHIQEIIESDLVFTKKIEQIIETRVEMYMETKSHFFQDPVLYSDEMKSYMSENRVEIKRLRERLYETGRSEGMICEDISNQTLELYFDSIHLGLSQKYQTLSNIPKNELRKFLKVVYGGLLACKVGM